MRLISADRSFNQRGAPLYFSPFGSAPIPPITIQSLADGRFYVQIMVRASPDGFEPRHCIADTPSAVAAILESWLESPESTMMRLFNYGGALPVAPKLIPLFNDEGVFNAEAIEL